MLSASILGAQAYPNHLEDRWQLTLSGASVILSSRLRIDGEASQGTTIDVERILGLDKNKIQPRFAAAWRPGRRHELELGYQFVRRSAEKVLTQQFVFRDSTYRVGENVHTTFNSDQLFLNYRYALRVRDRSELGLGVGVGTLFIDLGLDVLAAGGGGGSAQFSRARSLSAPTGSVGFYGKWAVGQQSYINADLRGVKVDVSSLNATVYEGGLGYRYFFTPRFGGELGYGISSFDLTITSTRANGNDVDTFIRYTIQNVRFGIVTSL